MASSTSSHLLLQTLLLPLLLLLLLQPRTSLSQTCTSQMLSKNRLYNHCSDLPVLSSYLHWTYNATSSSLNIAFAATPSSPNGWIAWAINPKAPAMVGSQTLIAYKKSDGSMTVKTFNVTSKMSITPSKIDFQVPQMESEFVNGVMRLYAKIILPKTMGSKLNQVWQVGGSVTNEIPGIHAFKPENLKSRGTLDLMKGETVDTGASASDSRLKKKNRHGILNVVSWGIMFPVGVLISRYLRVFKSMHPAWFYLHVFCQFSAYVIGVAGWGTGLKLGSQSKGVTYSVHRNIGISLFVLATLQIFALFLRPKPEHKFRLYWNIYHHGAGYAIVVLGIFNVFKGLDILVPDEKWRRAYIIVLIALGVFAVLLEAITWTVVLKRKSDKSTKPYDPHTGDV